MMVTFKTKEFVNDQIFYNMNRKRSIHTHPKQAKQGRKTKMEPQDTQTKTNKKQKQSKIKNKIKQ